MDINLTLFGEMITFIIFIWVTMKYIWPPIMKAMQERQKKIADGLEAAEEGKKSLELAEQKTKEMMNETKQEATSIIDKTNSRADQIVADAKAEATQENKRIIKNAQLEIDQQINNVKEVLSKEIVNLVIDGAEKVLAKDVDKKAHEKMLNELAESI